MKKRILTTFIILIVVVIAYGQSRTAPKKIKYKDEYLHTPTKTIFSSQLYDLNLIDIYSFDKKDLNIGATYENESEGRKTTVSIYLYPAKDGAEGRLRNEYLQSMQSIANLSDKGLKAIQSPAKFKGEKFICNGFKAVSKSNDNGITQLTLYECGTWFLKMRITSNQIDSTAIEKLESNITNYINPSRLTSLKTLNPKADIYFAKAAFRDSIMLGSAMGSAFKKLEWANVNIAENERASGFPDIYLKMHIESLKEFVKFEKDKKYTKSESTQQYLNELNKIIDSGFLGEFIMEQFSMIMIPDDIQFDFDKFKTWKNSNPITIDLNKRFYVVSYNQK